MGAEPSPSSLLVGTFPLRQAPSSKGFAMAKRLYVGNLPWTTTSAELEQMFAAHGSVRSAEVISDRETGRSRGFGFVEMDDEQGMNAAIQALNGQNVGGRPLTVNEAREKTPRPGGGGGGGYGRGGDRGGYGRR